MSDDLGRMLSIGSVSLGIFDGPHATPEKTNDGPVFLGIETLNQGRIDLSRAEHLSEEDFVRWTRRVVPQHDDLVFSYETRLGQAALIPAGLRCCLGRRMALVRPDQSKVIPRFLLYYFIGPEFQAVIRQRTIQGSTVDRILLREFPDFPVRVPSLSVQEEIAGVLGCLDDKIDLNGRMNQTLDAMARATFKSWFAGALCDLPPGWTIASLDSVSRFLNGLAMQKFPAREGEPSLPVIKIAELRRGDTASSDRASLEIPPEYVVEDGSVLFSWSGSLEVVVWTGGTGALNQHVFKVSSVLYPKWFYYYWLKHHLPKFRSIAADKATTMGHIQRRHLTEALVAVPPWGALEEMDRTMSPLLEKQIANSLESRTLATLRDTLLPKLLSGEIRVKQAEKLVREAV